MRTGAARGTRGHRNIFIKNGIGIYSEHIRTVSVTQRVLLDNFHNIVSSKVQRSFRSGRKEVKFSLGLRVTGVHNAGEV